MNEIMYDQNSVLIALGLLAAMSLAIEFGYRIGVSRPRIKEATKTQSNAIQGSLLGLLALLLGFTFSLALQRYDSRSQAVVNEANAIGTTYLRAQLLSENVREDVSALLRTYANIRVRASTIATSFPELREPLVREANRVTNDLWSLARRATEIDDRPVTTGLFIQSLNEMIDAFASRDAALERHVPEIVLFLLFFTFVLAGWMLGYTSGIDRLRPSFSIYIMVALIVLLVFIIIDLDRPRRGIIEVNQGSLIDLREQISIEP